MCVYVDAYDSSTQATKDLMLEVVAPAEHKKLGRKVKGFDHRKWDESETATSSMLN